MGGPLAGGGTGAVVPGGQAGPTAAWAASAVPRPSSGAAETAAATSPVDAIRFRRVRNWRLAGVPGSDEDVVIRATFLAESPCAEHVPSSGRSRSSRRLEVSLASRTGRIRPA